MPSRLQLLFCILTILLAGCRHEEPNPELLDPIFADLSSLEKADEASLEGEKKKLEKAVADEEKALPLTIDLNNARKERNRATQAITHLEQKLLFDHIRAQRRLTEDHLTYHEAFVAEKPWPPKDEYAQYLVNRRLNSVPMNWGAHLPKLFEKKPIAKAEKKKSEGEE